MSAALAHDLRQPLAAAKFMLDEAKEQASETALVNVLEKLDSTMDSMAQTVEQSLSVARSDSQACNTHCVNVAEIFERVFREAEVLAVQNGLELRVRATDMEVHTDPALLYRVLLNLVVNALHCSKSGGVLLAARRRRKGMLLQVFDTGPGLPELLARKLTDTTSGDRNADDSGRLGLLIVRSFCALLDISVSVRRKAGRGSTISLLVPDSSTD
ncbi:sensory transduction histidine kinase, putative [Ricinus communis]|uniref:histidine kinase n=1 Tax=Ricinus communis TaxID=3988 RepID=B9TDB6_RICCO|nr:sensory transduction histidine kinase, putative [Ricinus communis]|eukprot:XP_002536235.1 uncharacterized protein LOC8261265 [Ricinus communis]